MPERTLGGRTAGRADYPISLLQAAAALYGPDAVANLAEPSIEDPKSKSRKKSRD